VERPSLRSAIEASPQAPGRIDPKFKVTVERKLDDVGRSDDRPLFEPNAMLYAVQTQHGVPTVEALPQLTVVQIAKVEADTRSCVRI
jgi:hypothetical protein